MLRTSLALVAFAMIAGAATAAVGTTLTDGFESGNMDTWWVELGGDQVDANVESKANGAYVRTGDYAMWMYGAGSGDGFPSYIGAWWPFLSHGDTVARGGEFHAWVLIEQSVGEPELFLDATYEIGGFEETNGLTLIVPQDGQWHHVYIAYNPEYDDTRGSLMAYADDELRGEYIHETLKGGQLTAGGFYVMAAFTDSLKFWADDCEFSLVPEPGSLLAFGSGLVALAGAAFRRRR